MVGVGGTGGRARFGILLDESEVEQGCSEPCLKDDQAAWVESCSRNSLGDFLPACADRVLGATNWGWDAQGEHQPGKKAIVRCQP